MEYMIGSSSDLAVRVWKPLLNGILFCRLTGAIQRCCSSQSLQTLQTRLVTRYRPGVRYVIDLPLTLKSLKLTVWAATQVDALMRLSSLQELDLEFGDRSSDMKTSDRQIDTFLYYGWKQNTNSMSWVINEVIHTFQSIQYSCQTTGAFCMLR